MNMQVTEKEREFLRDLARKQMELANLPIMKEKERLWIKHNAVQGERPMVVMEDISFWEEICPKFVCESPFAQKLENLFYKNIIIVDLLADDKVVPPYFQVDYGARYQRYGLASKKVFASDGVGFHIEPVIECLEDDFHKLKETIYSYDPAEVQKEVSAIEDIIGDIIPVVPINVSNVWNISLAQQAVNLMGTENMFCAMIDEPDEFKEFMQYLGDDTLRLLKFQEESGCLQVNNGNQFMGSGSYCFSDQLPQSDYAGKPRLIDTWGHLNAQEAVGLSKDMFCEFILPDTMRVAHEFGLLYFGCCEPVSDFWVDGIEKIKNLRKVSVSAWCDEEYIAPRLAERNIIYSRKPSPNFIGIQSAFDEAEFRKYVQNSTAALKKSGGKAEFIFRDIYKLHGNLGKVKRAVEIVREETENLY